MREGTHYVLEKDNHGEYFVCLRCRRCFEKQYHPVRPQRNKYGPKQLLALWAWYNFERHLMSCWKKVKILEDKIDSKK